jgi:hypothetical protein
MGTSGPGAHPASRVGSTYSNHDRDEAAVSRFARFTIVVDPPTYFDGHSSTVGGQSFACLLSHQFGKSYVRALSLPPRGTPAVQSKLDLSPGPMVAQWKTSQSKLTTHVNSKLSTIVAHPRVNLLPNGCSLFCSPLAAPLKTVLGPISRMPRYNSPRPSVSPRSSPESSNSALKDSMCGFASSSRMGMAAPFVGGSLNLFSLSSVSYR